MLRGGTAISMYYRLLGSEIDGVVFGATLFALLYLIVAVEFPDDTGDTLSMLSFHPSYNIILGRIGSAHKRRDLVAEIRGQACGIITVDTEEEFPE